MAAQTSMSISVRSFIPAASSRANQTTMRRSPTLLRQPELPSMASPTAAALILPKLTSSAEITPSRLRRWAGSMS